LCPYQTTPAKNPYGKKSGILAPVCYRPKLIKKIDRKRIARDETKSTFKKRSLSKT
jgi:hypothetical protein